MKLSCHSNIPIMKIRLSLVVLLLSVCFTSELYAQKTKKTKEDKETEKEWKKKLNKLEPMAYKALVDERESLKGEVSSLNSRVVELETDLNTKNSDTERLKAELKAAEQKLADEQSTNVTKSGGKVSAKGVVFKVQIGAFRNKDLSKYFDNNPNFSGDVDADGTKKYSLGYFGDYWEADNFKKYLREMGVKDAWIVAYKNGQRVEIKDVLEGSVSSK